MASESNSGVATMAMGARIIGSLVTFALVLRVCYSIVKTLPKFLGAIFDWMSDFIQYVKGARLLPGLNETLRAMRERLDDGEKRFDSIERKGDERNDLLKQISADLKEIKGRSENRWSQESP